MSVIYSYFNTANQTFEEAEASCARIRGHLASLDTISSKDEITSHLQQQEMSYWWIGLRRHDGGWKWLNGRKFNRSVIDFAETVGEGNCGSLYQAAKGRRALLYDYGCSVERMSYVCEHVEATTQRRDASLGGTSELIDISAAIPSTMLTILVLILILFACVIKRKHSRRKSEDGLRMQNRSQPQRSDLASSTSKQPTDECDAGYATIDTIIYSEIIDDGESEVEGTQGMLGKRMFVTAL